VGHSDDRKPCFLGRKFRSPKVKAPRGLPGSFLAIGTFLGVHPQVMDIFLLMPRPGRGGGRLLDLMLPLAPFVHPEVFFDLPDLAARLRRPKAPESIALIHDPSHEDLRALAELKDYLRGMRILLVLPDQEEETIALAHKLLPSYITYVDNGTSGIMAIIRQLARAGADEAGFVLR
jgi:hypothetical protein